MEFFYLNKCDTESVLHFLSEKCLVSNTTRFHIVAQSYKTQTNKLSFKYLLFLNFDEFYDYFTNIDTHKKVKFFKFIKIETSETKI